MGTKFCTACGAPLSEGVRFCENCGAPAPVPDSQPAKPGTTDIPAASPVPPAPDTKRTIPIKLVAGLVAALVIVGILAVFLLPSIMPGPSSGLPSPSRAVATQTPDATVLPAQPLVTTIPTPVPDPFPGALKLKDTFPFGSGDLASEGTVYRVWMNDSYQWHNDMDNKYYTQLPKAGKKYLAVFVNVNNNGTTRVWPPTSNNIRVYYDGAWYSMDPVHFLPNAGAKSKDKPIEIKEIQYYSKLFGSEYVEDFGYSHGSPTAYLYPGKSNAIDGYILYEVPASLTLDKAYVRIAFNGNDTGIWKLG